MGDLNSDTQETIHLAIPESGSVRLIERMDSKHVLRLVQPIGSRSPLHASSTGKAILAHLPASEIDAYLDAGLVRVTSYTITDPDRLRAELQQVRERGYAVVDEEMAEGIVSVAASIRPGSGRPIAAISVSGPVTRMTPELRTKYGHQVSAAAAEVAALLRD